jgi:hypothetical protein
MLFLVLTGVISLFYLFLVVVLQGVALRLHVRSVVHVEIVMRITVAWEVMGRVHVVVGWRVWIIGIVVVVLSMGMHVGVVFVGLDDWDVVTVMMLVRGSVVMAIMLLVHNVFLGAGLDDLVMIVREFPVGGTPIVG